jgi:hypothetical protein
MTINKETIEIEEFVKTSRDSDLDLIKKDMTAWYDKDSGTLDIEYANKDIGVTGFGIKINDVLRVVAGNL